MDYVFVYGVHVHSSLLMNIQEVTWYAVPMYHYHYYYEQIETLLSYVSNIHQCYLQD